ncbi:stage V sporulation protein AA [Bacillus alveayuensis]|jgi:stage V sporulation protein AA|uniref:stage V sporulation protein AA n=1 Tax=Aeribacillus alveayuensis TaxID=279215 RepID=UPI0005D0EB86|nr:stage V sporulation protein AA [Bacillus alveayuensis]
MNVTVYLRLRHRIQVKPNEKITINKLATVIGDPQLKEQIENLEIHQVQKHDKSIIVIDAIQIIQKIYTLNDEIEIQTLGPTQTVVEVVYKKKDVSKVLLVLVWLLLFVGSGMAIMNFHEDVSMQKVHIRLYKIITGEVNKKPLLFQIPYSIGLGLGMILFFNHVFRKRINEEPSPLEVEVFNYQMDLDKYVSMNENKESMEKIDEH